MNIMRLNMRDLDYEKRVMDKIVIQFKEKYKGINITYLYREKIDKYEIITDFNILECDDLSFRNEYHDFIVSVIVPMSDDELKKFKIKNSGYSTHFDHFIKNGGKESEYKEVL